MIQLQTVPVEYLYQVWPIVEPWLNKSLEVTTDDINVDQLKVCLINRYQTLLIAVDDNKIIGAGTVQIDNFPNNRVLSITALGGRNIVKSEVFEQLEKWAKSQGVTKIKASAKEAQARLYKKVAGLNPVMHDMEKSI